MRSGLSSCLLSVASVGVPGVSGLLSSSVEGGTSGKGIPDSIPMKGGLAGHWRKGASPKFGLPGDGLTEAPGRVRGRRQQRRDPPGLCWQGDSGAQQRPLAVLRRRPQCEGPLLLLVGGPAPTQAGCTRAAEGGSGEAAAGESPLGDGVKSKGGSFNPILLEDGLKRAGRYLSGGRGLGR